MLPTVPVWQQFGTLGTLCLQENLMKFAQFAVRVWNVSMDFENPEKTALEGISRTDRVF